MVDFLDANGKVNKQIFLGLSLKSISINLNAEYKPGVIDFVFIQEPEQADFPSPLFKTFSLNLGVLEIDVKVESFDHTIIDATGKNIVTVRAKEVGIDAMSFHDLRVLHFNQLIIAHENEIISRREGDESEPIDETSTGAAIFNISEFRPPLVTSRRQLEVAGLPKSNFNRLLTPSLSTVLISLGFPPLMNNSFIADLGLADPTRRQQLSRGTEILIKRYPRRQTGGVQGMQIQFSETGIRTKYSFQKTSHSYMVRRIADLETAVNVVRRTSLEKLPIFQEALDNWSEINDLFPNDPVVFDPILLDENPKLNEELHYQLRSVAWMVDISDREKEQIEAGIKKPTGGLGVITANVAGGPFYDIRRLNNIDIDPRLSRYWMSKSIPPEWTNVRNLSEHLRSPGFVEIGTTVTVQIYDLEEDTGSETEITIPDGTPFIEHSPQVFSPPVSSE